MCEGLVGQTEDEKDLNKRGVNKQTLIEAVREQQISKRGS